MKKRFFSGVLQPVCSIFLLICFICIILPDNSFSEEEPAMEIPPSCVVHKIRSTIIIDGKLDEECWKKAPKMEYLGIADGSLPPWNFYGKILWDDKYFYIGISIEDPNVWATMDQNTPPPTARVHSDPQYIMNNDGFLTIFFDPDADGITYAEMHINAFNKADRFYFDYPYHTFGEKWQDWTKPDNFHLEHRFEGLKKAVFIDGTLNNPKDIDKGWSVEVAFPWESIKPLTRGSCPPKPGDVWRANFGRVMLNAPKAQHTYYTWPVMGVVDCHRLRRWGYIVFASEYKEIVY